MFLMLVVRMIDVVVRAVRLILSGTPAGIALAVALVLLFVAGTFSAVALGAWLLGSLESNYHWVDVVLPCPFGGSCPAY